MNDGIGGGVGVVAASGLAGAAKSQASSRGRVGVRGSWAQYDFSGLYYISVAVVIIIVAIACRALIRIRFCGIEGKQNLLMLLLAACSSFSGPYAGPGLCNSLAQMQMSGKFEI